MCVEMKQCSDSKDVMKRFEMAFLNESRECIFHENVSQINVVGEKFGPFKKGDRASLPNWIIENLLKHELIGIIPQEAPEEAYESLKSLQNLYYNEEKEPQLQKFPPFLYTAIARKSQRLQSDKTSMDPKKYTEVAKLRKIAESLIKTRESKILRVAKSGAYQEKRDQMAHEERWLCEELIELLSGWRQNIME